MNKAFDVLEKCATQALLTGLTSFQASCLPPLRITSDTVYATYMTVTVAEFSVWET